MNFINRAKPLILQIKTSKTIQRLLIGIATATLVVAGLIYWWINSGNVSTDDAYINANVVQIASRVAGPISELHVTNNQFVHRGELLFIIDRAPYQVALNKAEAELVMKQASQHYAQLAASRALTLTKTNSLSKQDRDNAITNLEVATAAVNIAKATIDQAKLELQYTSVVAPNDGWIANLSLRVGNVVTPNQPLFALIDNSQYWVDANFKETELAKIRSGQSAIINVDMYDNHQFRGVVESISGGSSSAFSLLPPENATGNWVKVVQRVPVKIRILTDNPSFPLRIGTTATVVIKTHHN